MAFYEENHLVKLFVNSRIVVDAAYFRKANPKYAKASINKFEKERSPGNGWIIWGNEDGSEKSSDSVKSNGMEPSEAKGNDLLIGSPTVPGFSLASKICGEDLMFLELSKSTPLANALDVAEFAVDDIRDIKWRPDSFAHLQIPDKKKKAIRALAKAHMKRASTSAFSFDDFIAGKGLGFNVLL